MQNLKFLYGKEKKKLMEKLAYYGIEKLPFLLVESGKEKIRGYSGTLAPEEIINISKIASIEIIGLYLFHNYEDNIRLSFDAVHALKSQITQNILEITDEQAKEFLKGNDVLLTSEDEEKLKQKSETRGFKIIKNRGDLLGTGKLVEGRIVNYMPKERRLR